MKLKYYSEGEFRAWLDKMDPVLLRLLDNFRRHWGDPVLISPAPGALGRRIFRGEKGWESQHNVERWGVVRAADVMPVGLSYGTARKAIDLATDLGFTGIGFYPHWSPAPGLHLDVRYDRVVGDPALWGAVDINGKQVYVPIEQALSNAA